MKISEVKPGQGEVNIEGEVISIEEPRTFNKFGKNLTVANATIKDDSGKIKLTLWNDDIGKIKQGDKIKITKGYAKEFNGEKQITTGKFGKLEVLGAEGSECKSGKVSEEEFQDSEEEVSEEDLL